jgi:hypothetical protein
LLAADPLAVLYEDRECNARARWAGAIQGGKAFLLEGIHDGPQGRYQTLKALAALSGQELWHKHYPTLGEWIGPVADPRGQLLALALNPHLGAEQRQVLVNSTTGELLGTTEMDCVALAPEGQWLISARPLDQVTTARGYTLHRRGDARPILFFATEAAPTLSPQFDATGELLVWGNPDGTVTVCHLATIRAHLREAGILAE